VTDKHSWERYERLRRITLILWAAWFPYVFVVAWWMRGRWDRFPLPLLLFNVIWFLFLTVVGLRVGYWPCPRCGKPFFLRFGLFKTRGKECPHCRLPYGENGPGR
jgi:hypothetical protein